MAAQHFLWRAAGARDDYGHWLAVGLIVEGGRRHDTAATVLVKANVEGRDAAPEERIGTQWDRITRGRGRHQLPHLPQDSSGTRREVGQSLSQTRVGRC